MKFVCLFQNSFLTVCNFMAGQYGPRYFREKNNIRWVGALSIGKSAFLLDTIDRIAFGIPTNVAKMSDAKRDLQFLSNNKSPLYISKKYIFVFR